MREIVNRELRLKILELYDTQNNFAKILGVSDSLVSAVIRRGWRLNDDQYKEWVEKLGGFEFNNQDPAPESHDHGPVNP
jgi:hypothetical protein